MAVNRLWYPDRMLSRSQASPPIFHRIPSSVESCLQWSDTAAESAVVKTKVTTTTESIQQRDVHVRHQRQQQLQQQQEASLARFNDNTCYNGRRTDAPYDARHKATR